MSTRDSDALVIEADVAFSLPDPTTVTGRKHLLSNTATASIVVSSTGATPFSTGGTLTATITLPAGQSIIYQSDGVRWVAKSSGGRPFFAGTAVTDASGNAVFNFPAGLFAAAPVVDLAIQFAAGSNPIDFRITALSATAATVNVRQSPTLIVLSLSVLGVAAPLAGVTVHCIATPAGSTP